MASNFQFPTFNVPFPYSSLPEQLQASMVPPGQQFTNGSQYGRWNGVNNNAFGLFPDQWPSVFGSPVPQPMQFQPPWGNNGTLGSNQGPGSNPGMSPPPGPPPGGSAGGPPTPTGDNFGGYQPIQTYPAPNLTPG